MLFVSISTNWKFFYWAKFCLKWNKWTDVAIQNLFVNILSTWVTNKKIVVVNMILWRWKLGFKLTKKQCDHCNLKLIGIYFWWIAYFNNISMLIGSTYHNYLLSISKNLVWQMICSKLEKYKIGGDWTRTYEVCVR